MRLAFLLHASALLCALTVAPACDDGTDTGPAGDGDDLAAELVRPDFDHVVIDVPAQSRPVVPSAPASPAAPADPATDVRIPDTEPEPAAEPPAACLCPDDACVRAWIETAMGCAVCVLIVCGDDDHRGGCVACPPAP
jgi:hypothetical protein